METEESELKWNEVQGALGNLPLTWVTIGDYIVINNNKPHNMYDTTSDTSTYLYTVCYVPFLLRNKNRRYRVKFTFSMS